jgi:hypothetical protein
VAFEHLDPAWRRRPAPARFRWLLSRCREILTAAASDPTSVDLVVSGDFARSTTRAVTVGDEGEYEPPGGIVTTSACVRRRTDGRLAVLVPISLLLEGALSDAPMRHAIAVVSHEAEHVRIMQAGEPALSFLGLPWGRELVLMVAQQVVNEYRADSGVSARDRTPFDPTELLAALTSLDRVLAELVAQAVPPGRWNGRLGVDAIFSLQDAWTILAMSAARLRNEGGTTSAVRSSLTTETLWQTYAARDWDSFVAALAQVPPRATFDDPTALRAHIETVEVVLQRMLRHAGFRWRNHGRLVLTGRRAREFNLVARKPRGVATVTPRSAPRR